MTKGRAIRYSEAELVFIEALSRLPRKDLHQAFVTWSGRGDVSQTHLTSLCKRKGWLTGRTGCFPKGHEPQNKGKKMPFNPNSTRTQFKKGRLPHNTRSAGHERADKNGYVWISVEETNPYTGFERRYVMKHHWLWERENGPLPEGMCLKSVDGDRSNTDPSNWMAIPRALLPRLNARWSLSYNDAEPELKPYILAVAKLEHAAREAKRKE